MHLEASVRFKEHAPEAVGIVSASQGSHDADLFSDISALIRAGRADEAAAQIARENAARLSPALTRLRGTLALALQVLNERDPDRHARGDSSSVAALGCILKILAARRTQPPATRRLTDVALITGHLGAGGAELQMARTAEMLAAAAGSRQKIAGVKLAPPFHVIVNSLAPEPGRPLNFFRPRLARRKIPILSMEDFPVVEPEDLSPDDPTIAALLPLLHPNIRKGLRLTPWYRSKNIQVAYIWQDGPILQFAVAALLAGVPRVVLNFRGMPPVLRWKMHLPEYEALYTALAVMPGVTLVCNSSKVAQAYSEWIGFPRDAFHLVLNGAGLHSAHPGSPELKIWSEFNASTKDATITVGGIFRMHPNKRPLEWLRFARRYLDSHPKARFVLIGSGMLFDTVKEVAQALGLTGRLLMIRQTKAGTFWLRKMDVFVLLSRYEGTPNVLIEAQLAGVPVVCTPVANATDTFVNGVTGVATSSTAEVDADDVVSKVDQIVAHARGTLYRYAQRHIAARYSARSMIEHTTRILSGHDTKCCVRSLEWPILSQSPRSQIWQ
jgi:glycosyltransferase involved in cell wall biosynthesis